MKYKFHLLIVVLAGLISGCASSESPTPVLPPPVVLPSPPIFLDEVDDIVSNSLGEFLPPIKKWPAREYSDPAPDGSSSILRTIPLSSLAYFPRLKRRLWNALEIEGISEFEIVRYPSPGGESWELTVDSEEMVAYRVELVQKIVGRAAIIIDDFGNSLRNKERLLELDYPLTLAIMPGLPYSTRIDRLAADNGFKVLLHCPLDAINADLPLGPGGIHCDTPADELIRIFDDDIQGLPHIVGVNNHMGSAFTTNTEAMRRLLTEVKRNDLFFVDSLTIGGTVSRAIAKELGVPFAKRDIFLDHKNTEEFIRRQFEVMKRKALSRGSVIAIGHDRPLTIRMLQRLIPTLAEDNIQLVPVSSLIKE